MVVADWRVEAAKVVAVDEGAEATVEVAVRVEEAMAAAAVMAAAAAKEAAEEMEAEAALSRRTASPSFDLLASPPRSDCRAHAQSRCQAPNQTSSSSGRDEPRRAPS